MGFPQSFCGWSLQLGAKIIAWFNVISGVTCIFPGVAGIYLYYTDNTEKLLIYSIASNVMGIIGVVLGIILLMGIYKKRPSYMKFWVIATVVLTAISVISGVVECIMRSIDGEITLAFFFIFVSDILLAIDFYLLVVVSSYRKEMESGETSA